MFKRTVCALLCCCAPLSAQTLDKELCGFIHSFNDLNQTSFVENFLFMNHNRELCVGGTNCVGPISKRTKPVNIAIGEFVTDDSALLEVVTSNLRVIRNWFSAITGLNVQIVDRTTQPTADAGFIRVEIVDAANAANIKELKTDQGKVEFEWFWDHSELSCLALNGDWLNSGYEYSEVWIKADQPYVAISECLTEEIYHTFGVRSDPIGLASLYSESVWLPQQNGAPLYTYPSRRDVTVLRILYDELITNGDDVETSKAQVIEIIQRGCLEQE